MMTPSNESIFRIIVPLCGETIGHRGIPLSNNRETGELGRRPVHHDVTLMINVQPPWKRGHGISVFIGCFSCSCVRETMVFLFSKTATLQYMGTS